MTSEKFKTSSHYEELFKRDAHAVFHEIHSEEQEEDYSCGPAVVRDILKTLGHEVTQNEIIDDVRQKIPQFAPDNFTSNIEEIGTPPEIIISILKDNNVDFEIKSSVEEKTEQADNEAQKYLEEKLKAGYVIVTPVQTIPDNGEVRNIYSDGHYVIVCGVMHEKGKMRFIVADPMFHYYQRLSNEGSLYGVHKGDAADVTTPKVVQELEYDTVETRNVYSPDELDTFDIDPSMYGLRIVDANNFIKDWQDISGFGDKYNLYGIAVKV